MPNFFYDCSHTATTRMIASGSPHTEVIKITGHGHGFYLAKLIAAQHDAKLTATSKELGDNKFEHYFALTIPFASFVTS